MKYNFCEMQSDEIHSLLRQANDGPDILSTEKIIASVMILVVRDPTQLPELDTHKSWPEFLIFYKPDMKKGREVCASRPSADYHDVLYPTSDLLVGTQRPILRLCTLQQL